MKAPILVGELISRDGFAPPVKTVLTKTWLQKFWEFVRSIIASLALIGVGWVLNELVRGIYG